MNSSTRVWRMGLIMVGGPLLALPIIFNSCDNLGKVTGESLLPSTESPFADPNNPPDSPSKPLVAEINITLESDPITVGQFIILGSPPVSYEIIERAAGTINQSGEFVPTEPGHVKIKVSDGSLKKKELTINVINPKLELNFSNESLETLVDGTPSPDILKFGRFDSPSTRLTNVNQAGFVKNAPKDGSPRFGYHPISQNPIGVLIEQPSTNLLNSTDFSKWTTGGSTNFSSLKRESPEGVKSAVVAYATSPNDLPNYNRISYNVTPDSGYSTGVHTFSFWGKADTNGDTKINALLISEETTTQEIQLTQTWKRYRITGNIQSGEGITLRLKKTLGHVFRMIIWGPQLEAGRFATSFIPTNDGPRRRAGESLEVEDLSWFNQDEGTWVIQWSSPGMSSENTEYLLNVSDGTEAQALDLFKHGKNNVTEFKIISGTSGIRLKSPNNSPMKPFTIKTTVFSYSGLQLIGYENGATMGSMMAPEQPLALNTLTLGYQGSASINYLNGYIKSVVYFPAKLIEKDLQRLSSQRQS